MKQHLCLGDLTGNRFTLTLRNITADKGVVEAALGSLKNKGFINYFGLQRFGTGIVPTSDVGRAMIK